MQVPQTSAHYIFFNLTNIKFTNNRKYIKNVWLIISLIIILNVLIFGFFTEKYLYLNYWLIIFFIG